MTKKTGKKKTNKADKKKPATPKKKPKKKGNNPQGRPSRFTPEIAQKISAAVSHGNYNVTACKMVGISESTFYSWLESAKNDRELYEKGTINKKTELLDFLEDIERSEAMREAKWVKDISSDPSWQSKAWLLERKYNGRWGRKELIKVGGDKNNPIGITFEARVKRMREDRGLPVDLQEDDITPSLNIADSYIEMDGKDIIDSSKDKPKKGSKSFLKSIKEKDE